MFGFKECKNENTQDQRPADVVIKDLLAEIIGLIDNGAFGEVLTRLDFCEQKTKELSLVQQSKVSAVWPKVKQAAGMVKFLTLNGNGGGSAQKSYGEMLRSRLLEVLGNLS